MADLLDLIKKTLCDADGWGLERQFGYDGEVTIVAENVAAAQEFAFHGNAGRVELVRMLNDDMIPCGTYSSVQLAVEALLRVASNT